MSSNLKKFLNVFLLVAFVFAGCQNQVETKYVEKEVIKEVQVPVTTVTEDADFIRHYKLSVDGKSFVFAEEENTPCAKGTELSTIAKDYTGFTANSMSVVKQTNGKNCVNVYYTRHIITVTLHGNGGTVNGESTASYIGLYESPLTILSSDLDVSHDAMFFDSWNTNADGSATKYEDGQFILTAPETLYAVWSYQVEASKAATLISSLPSKGESSYPIKIKGAVTPEIMTTIRDALATDQTRLVDLDLSGVTGLTSLADEAFTVKEGYTYKGLPLTSLVLPDTVTTIGVYCFYNCKKLKSVKAKGVTTLAHGAFYVCEALTRVELPDEMDEIVALAFGSCRSLTELVLNATKVNLGAVGGCSKLTKLTIGPRVTTLTGFPYSVNSLSEIKVLAGNTSCKVTNGILYSYNGQTLLFCPPALNITSLTIPTTVTTIANRAFQEQANLVSVSSTSVTTLESNAFERCKKLATVNLSALEKIDSLAFTQCKALSSITLPDTLTEIGWSAFQSCTALSSIFIPLSVTLIGSSWGDYSAFDGWTASQTINCAAASKPAGWNNAWADYATYGTDTAPKATINWGASRP